MYPHQATNLTIAETICFAETFWSLKHFGHVSQLY